MKTASSVISITIAFLWKSNNQHNFRQINVLLKKLLKSWFHENFWAWSRIIVLFHTIIWPCYCNMKIREISEHYCIVVRRIKKLISRNFFWKIEIIFKIFSKTSKTDIIVFTHFLHPNCQIAMHWFDDFFYFLQWFNLYFYLAKHICWNENWILI